MTNDQGKIEREREREGWGGKQIQFLPPWAEVGLRFFIPPLLPYKFPLFPLEREREEGEEEGAVGLIPASD